MSMIEKIARAIQAEKYPVPVANDTMAMDWDMCQNRYRKMARAALAAMRYPTDDMIAAAAIAPFGTTLAELAENTFSAMIDAALEGEQ